MQMRIKRLIADFIKDYEGVIWLINVKSIEVEDLSKSSEIQVLPEIVPIVA